MNKALEVFFIFLKLGCTSYGGPIAHIGFFQEEFVSRRKWLDEKKYADIVSLCQFLPGPASSQIGMTIGQLRAGFFGAVFAWLGFTMPSAIIMILFALGVTNFPEYLNEGILHGFKIAAVAVVAQALWQMSIKLCPDKERMSIAIGSAIFVIFFPVALAQILVILMGAFVGKFFLPQTKILSIEPKENARYPLFSYICIFLFFSILVLSPLIVKFYPLGSLKLFDSFYRVGSLVFGGGHVVLPLLKQEVVSSGWVSNESFLAGYGVAQTIPGPLFAFAAFLGAASSLYPHGWIGGLLALVSVFLPSFLLVLGVYPFWEKFRQNKFLQNALSGINASVVGLLLAAFYNPVWTSAIFNSIDFALLCFLFLLLMFWKIPSWGIVVIAALLGIWIS
jgi:chromate transporter